MLRILHNYGACTRHHKGFQLLRTECAARGLKEEDDGSVMEGYLAPSAGRAQSEKGDSDGCSSASGVAVDEEKEAEPPPAAEGAPMVEGERMGSSTEAGREKRLAVQMLSMLARV